MVERVKVALPTLVKVTDKGPLVVPTPWLLKLMVVELKEKPGVDTGTSAVLPPPPQDVHHKAMAMQAVARTTTFPR
jgi:hypothetical protein